MFLATMCPSSGETTVFLRHLVLVRWLFAMKGGISFQPTHYQQKITSTKCRKNTVVSPDDGHIVARNMQRLINILRINCAPSWLYLQDYKEMHGQQNIQFRQQFLSKNSRHCSIGCSIPHKVYYFCYLPSFVRNLLTWIKEIDYNLHDW